jgi:hypothetical protein
MNTSDNSILTGDILVSRNRRPSVFNRLTTAVTGSITHHNECVVIVDGQPVGGRASTPHFNFYPLATRLADDESDFAVYRYPGLTDVQRIQIDTCVRLCVDMQIPYDRFGIISMVLAAANQREWQFWCTESVFAFYKRAGIVLLANQPKPSPVHIERLIKNGVLQCVLDPHMLHGAIVLR